MDDIRSLICVKVYTIFLFFIGIFITGVFVGWLINFIKQRKCFIDKEIMLFDYKDSLESALYHLELELNLRKHCELELHDEKKASLDLANKLAIAENKVMHLNNVYDKCESLNHDLNVQQEINKYQAIEIKEILVKIQEYKHLVEEKQQTFVDNEKMIFSNFEKLVNHYFEVTAQKIYQKNEVNLTTLLAPLRAQLDDFCRQMHVGFNEESRERHTLSYEINQLKQMNLQITQEAINLTNALKGNNKIQGNWGEMVLSKILENSGLREGHEFYMHLSVKHEDDSKILYPDVVVRLPHGKDIVIDSKTSLVAYERYFNSDNESDRNLAILDHVNSLRSHIKLLGKKNYRQLSGLRTLDYVLMFVPIEPAFIIAIDKRPELINEAISNNVMLVSPTTLLVALRTINNLWRYENQNRNAQQIADRATLLYDKLRLFIDDINSIGRCLDKAQLRYNAAKNKLFEGRGNIMSQAEMFRVLGVEIKRPIVFDKTTSD